MKKEMTNGEIEMVVRLILNSEKDENFTLSTELVNYLNANDIFVKRVGEGMKWKRNDPFFTPVEEKYKLSDFHLGLADRWVATYEFKKLGKKTTVCLMTLRNKFEIVGTSACVNVDLFDKEVGQHYAMLDAFNQLGEYDAFYRQEMENNDDGV